MVLTVLGNRAFIGGADLNELGALCADSARLFITRLHYACKAIRDCPVPVIGPRQRLLPRRRTGGGGELRHAGWRRARHGSACPRCVMGLPSVIEAALLPGLIGWGRTREMLLTGAHVFRRRGAGDEVSWRRSCRPATSMPRSSAGSPPCATPTPEAVRAQKALMDRWERVSVEEGIYGRHRRALRGLQDRRATGCDRGVLCRSKEARVSACTAR